MSEGEKLPERILQLLDPGERIVHAVKKLPSLEKPKWVIVTDRRLIVFDEKILGRYDLVAVPYQRLYRIRFRKGLLASEFEIEDEDGNKYRLEWMEKNEAVEAIEAVRSILASVSVEPPTVTRNKGLFAEEIVMVKPREALVRSVTRREGERGASIVERLERLAELYDRGIISREEFERLKARLLEDAG